MNRLGAKSNSGEGGEDRARFEPFASDMEERSFSESWHPAAGDHANSAIKQVASGRFGVTPQYLASAKEIEIKMAQGSKPGEGGQIPGFKVSAEIAAIRHAVPGVTLISPPPHHDIYSIEDLAQLIYDLKRVSPGARVGVKLVSSWGVGTIAAGVAKGYADNIQVSGHDGGTGASPLSSVKHSGQPWELGLIDVQRALIENDLRGRVTLRVDGGLKTARDVVIAAALGAEEFGFGTTALVALGCAMLRQCHLNTCAVGIATQDPELRRRFAGHPDHVVRFFMYLAESVRHELARVGARSISELVGRWEHLRPRKGVTTPKGVSLDVAGLLDVRALPKGRARSSRQDRNHRPGRPGGTVDEAIATEVADWLEHGRERPLALRNVVSNRERSLGAGAAGLIAARHGDEGLPAGSLELSFEGVAGQSFGAFALPGMRLVLDGEAQDYVGKSLAGGEIVLRQPAGEVGGVIAGNTVLYGATAGTLLAAGSVGERVCVRNSGATAVVEGCGDHACEYMTGGTVVVLGPVGRNFAAGMSGGEAFVLDETAAFEQRLNDGMVTARRLAKVDGVAEERLLALLRRHADATGSRTAVDVLAHWPTSRARFWYVTPLTAEHVPLVSPEVAAQSLPGAKGRTATAD